MGAARVLLHTPPSPPNPLKPAGAPTELAPTSCTGTGHRLAYEGWGARPSAPNDAIVEPHQIRPAVGSRMNGVSRTDAAPSLRVIWLAVLAILGVLTLAALWYPIQRISQSADINYNEGWNTYRADIAARGEPLYSQPPRFTVTNYPPLSFHILGFLGKLLGGFTAAGRWTALASLLFLAVAMAALVRQFSGQWPPGVYAAFLFVLGLAVFVPDRIG